MTDKCCELSVIVSHILLFIVSLGATKGTYQVNRGAAAGFLLQALTSVLRSAYCLFNPVGLNLEDLLPAASWIFTVIGLPLLAFGFHWLSGDHSTANTILGGGVLLAAGFEYFTEDGRTMMAYAVIATTSVSILIVSIFTGNAYGILGSMALSAAGLLSTVKTEALLVLRKEAALDCVLAAGTLAFQRSLKIQYLDFM
ncbi:transmembrane protein 276 isoform X2 [Microcaecilia unicolor]|nr:uncharacterized protein LOC115481121 isoform X2 [Microcaecilia unicolor]XP_030076032.1 uncharacterized protein LOC115481121 isoform X2 [Microcaecilia unicolor]